MKSRIVMLASALFLGIVGMIALFAPQELLAAAGVPPSPLLTSLVQLCSALLLGFAMTNWMTKGSRVGGIYNRPIANGNLVHFTVGAITLVRFALQGHVSAPVIALAAAYTLFALAFAAIIFGRC